MPSKKKAYKRSKSAYKKKVGIPRISYSDKMAIRMQNAGLDVKPIQFRILDDILFEFDSSDGKVATQYSQPLKKFVDSSYYTTYVKPVYNEYRILKAKYHLIFFNSNALTATTPSAGVIMPITQLAYNPSAYVGSGNNCHSMISYGWLRSAKYGVDPEFADTTALQTCLQLPGGQIKPINGQDVFELFSSITAAKNEEKVWLSTKSPPDVEPNEEFFNPCICFAMENYLAAVDPNNIMTFKVIIDLIVECRGSKLTSEYQWEPPGPTP